MNRAARWSAVAVLVICISALAVAPASAADLSQAIRTYASYCASCHGKWGHGNGPSAVALKVKPADLTAPALQKLSDETLFKTIKEGGPSVGLSPEMHAWGQGFDDKQIKRLVAYIRTLPKGN